MKVITQFGLGNLTRVTQFRAIVDNHDNDGDGIFDIFFSSVGQSVSSNGWREYQEIVRRMVTTRLLEMIMAMMGVMTMMMLMTRMIKKMTTATMMMYRNEQARSGSKYIPVLVWRINSVEQMAWLMCQGVDGED